MAGLLDRRFALCRGQMKLESSSSIYVAQLPAVGLARHNIKLSHNVLGTNAIQAQVGECLLISVPDSNIHHEHARYSVCMLGVMVHDDSVATHWWLAFPVDVLHRLIDEGFSSVLIDIQCTYNIAAR